MDFVKFNLFIFPAQNKNNVNKWGQNQRAFNIYNATYVRYGDQLELYPFLSCTNTTGMIGYTKSRQLSIGDRGII